MRKCLISCMMIVCSTMLNAQEQAPKTKRITNIAVGLNHHHDSLLNSRLNVGLVSEVDSLRGLQVGLLYGGIDMTPKEHSFQGLPMPRMP